ncbi:FimV/HubP family polar landmark protein, partial [Lysobacter enzymogenes]|uniref:FimV/HubP family polar landmark protein n=1 Tax=Lysobacter enzymogenes TaxID=69 RepID=UPI00240686F1
APAARAPGRASDARLEIVPPGAERATAGAQSGISAGGEGHMVREQVQQANETIAVREQELADLKSKVAELEKLSTDQQKLIAMKDSELAATQQRLAENQARADSGSPLPWIFGGLGLLALLAGGWVLSRREPKRPNFRAASPVPVPFAAPAEPGPDPVETLRRKPEAAAVVDPVAQLLGRRDEPAAVDPVFAADVGPDADSDPDLDVARDERPAAAPRHALDELAAAEPSASRPLAADEPPAAAERTDPVAAPHWTAPVSEPKSQARVPTWHSSTAGRQPPREEQTLEQQLREPPAPPAGSAAPVGSVPAASSPTVSSPAASSPAASSPTAPVPVAPVAAAPVAAQAPSVEPVTIAQSSPQARPAAPSAASVGLERIELARAYLDLGDQNSARQLLGEVLINGDHAARQQAARLLRELEAAGGDRAGA